MVESSTPRPPHQAHARSAQTYRLTEWKGKVRGQSPYLDLARNNEAHYLAPAGFFMSDTFCLAIGAS